MKPIVLGSSGRLAGMLKLAWGDDGADWRGRDVGRLLPDQPVIDLRGVVPGQGDVTINVRLARDVLDAARGAGAGRVFLASSAAVYGRHSGPLIEEIAEPISDYGRAKHALEQIARDTPHPATCLRIGNVAGADAILGGYRPGFTLDQFEDGQTPRRSYIGPASFASALHQLVTQTALPSVLNFAVPGVVAMGDLLDAAGYAWTPQVAGPDAIPCVALDTTLLLNHVAFGDNAGTVKGIVAEYRAYMNAP